MAFPQPVCPVLQSGVARCRRINDQLRTDGELFSCLAIDRFDPADLAGVIQVALGPCVVAGNAARLNGAFDQRDRETSGIVDKAVIPQRGASTEGRSVTRKNGFQFSLGQNGPRGQRTGFG